MLDTDEIKARFEGLYDEVCSKVKETEGTDDQIKWQEVELCLNCILEILDAIERQESEPESDPESDLLNQFRDLIRWVETRRKAYVLR